MKVSWIGKAPLLVDKPIHDEAVKTKKKPQDTPPNEKLYVQDGVYQVPNRNVLYCIKDGAGRVIERNRTTYGKTILGFVSIENVWIPIRDKSGKVYKPLDGEKQSWKAFSRFIRRSQGDRIWVSTPMFEEWRLDFDLEVDSQSIPEDLVIEIMKQAGKIYGFGGFRPGGFGRFEVKVN